MYIHLTDSFVWILQIYKQHFYSKRNVVSSSTDSTLLDKLALTKGSHVFNLILSTVFSTPVGGGTSFDSFRLPNNSSRRSCFKGYLTSKSLSFSSGSDWHPESNDKLFCFCSNNVPAEQQLSRGILLSTQRQVLVSFRLQLISSADVDDSQLSLSRCCCKRVMLSLLLKNDVNEDDSERLFLEHIRFVCVVSVLWLFLIISVLLRGHVLVDAVKL